MSFSVELSQISKEYNVNAAKKIFDTALPSIKQCCVDCAKVGLYSHEFHENNLSDLRMPNPRIKTEFIKLISDWCEEEGLRFEFYPAGHNSLRDTYVLGWKCTP